MAHNPKLSNTTANAAVDAATALLNTGYFRIYDGTQPINANTAITTQVLVGQLRFSATAFGAAVAGVATANAITADTSAAANATITWFRLLKSDGTTVIADGSVGTSGADLNVTTTSILIGQTINVTSFTYTQSEG